MKDYAPTLRKRHDGWTVERQHKFLDCLGHTGCVTDASRIAGVSVTSARRLQNHFPEFAKAWDAALKRAGQGLEAVAYKRAVEGRETIIIRKGKEVERRITPSDSMLSLLLKRAQMNVANGSTNYDNAAANAIAVAISNSQNTLTFEEHKNNWTFNKLGKKYQQPDPAIESAAFGQRIMDTRTRLQNYAKAGGGCPCCQQQLPENWPQESIMELQVLGVVNMWSTKDGWRGLGPTHTQPEPVDVFIPPLR